jgi:endoglucanase
MPHALHQRRRRRPRPIAALIALGAASLVALAVTPSPADGTSGASAAPAFPAVTGGATVRVIRDRAAAARKADLLAGRPLYLERAGPAATQARAWSAARPADAELVRWIARQPQALWLGDWHRDVRGLVARRVRAARATGTVPVLVAYNIPGRDCGQHSQGGAADTAAYARWIDAVARGIGPGPAAVILEPDALAGMSCLPRRERSARVAALSAAVDRLTAGGGTEVYIDAGNPGWVPARTMAGRLRSAGVARARGFALNVSGFETTARVARYGSAISRRAGRARFVVDTSRNGNGPHPRGVWCNPPGRALGEAPTTETGHPLIDAYLWIKRPGESDGTCNGGPPAGRWWPEYALELARGAGR